MLLKQKIKLQRCKAKEGEQSGCKAATDRRAQVLAGSSRTIILWDNSLSATLLDYLNLCDIKNIAGVNFRCSCNTPCTRKLILGWMELIDHASWRASQVCLLQKSFKAYLI